MKERLPNPLLFTLFTPVMPRFAEQVGVAIEALSANVPQPFEENEFIDASRLVYDGVRDIRKAVLMIRVCEVSVAWSSLKCPVGSPKNLLFIFFSLSI